MILKQKPFKIAFILFFLAFFLRFFNFWHPQQVVFDEAHFGLYASKYAKGEYYFDIHPPGGKLIFAAIASFPKNNSFNFQINTRYPSEVWPSILKIRFLNVVLGSLLVVIIFYLALELNLSLKIATLAALWVSLDNALIVESRLVLLNTILIFFIFLSILLYLRLKKIPFKSPKWYFQAFILSICLGIAISIKVNGFILLAFIILNEIINSKFSFKNFLTKSFFYILIPFSIYVGFFAIHLSLLKTECTSNCGYVFDIILGPKQSHPILTNKIPQGNFWNNFINLNIRIITDNIYGLNHWTYSSKFYQWPFGWKPILYFYQNEGSGSNISAIYLSSNFISWWLATFGILLFVLMLIKSILKKQNFYLEDNLLLIFELWLFFLLPFLIVQRFALMYHYFVPLILSILFTLGFIEYHFKKLGKILPYILVVLVLGFVYFAPITYGFAIPHNLFEKLYFFLPK